ncbi:MAG: hypothetical protein EOP09_05390 [Proteobacteria bacterium]|nr:MAG: hypothetical protein EOP09_05390 [Pseudomonadota bacterium]
MKPVKVVIDDGKYNWKVDKASIQKFMKDTGLSGKKRQTVAEYYAKVRANYPESFRKQMDLWVQANRGELMPEFQVSTFQDAEGKEQIRLQASTGGQSATISYAPDSVEKYLKFNNTFLSRADLIYPNNGLLKLAKGDKMIMKSLKEGKRIDPLKTKLALSYEDFKRLTPSQRASYMIRIRELVATAEMVSQRFNKKTASNLNDRYEYFVQLVLGTDAEAEAKTVRGAKPGDKCIINGYVSTYGENYSCGGTKSGAKDFAKQQNIRGASCPNGGRSCNPLLYRQPSGAQVCVTDVSKLREATSGGCPEQSPLKTAKDKENLLNAFLISKDAKSRAVVDDDGYRINKKDLSREDYESLSEYILEVNEFVDNAVNTCKTVPLSDIKSIRDEQASACAALPQRKINVEFYDGVVVVPPPLPPPAPPTLDCQFQMPGSILNEGECACESPRYPGTITDPERGPITACIDKGVVIVTNPPTEKVKCNDDETKEVDKKTGKETCVGAGFFSRNKGLIIGGVIGLGLLGFFFSRRGGSSTPAPAPVVDPCGIATAENMALCHPPVVPPPVAPPPVQPPPVPTNTPPTVVVDPPPPVVPPPVVIPEPIPTTTETTSNTNDSTATGVRKSNSRK